MEKVEVKTVLKKEKERMEKNMQAACLMISQTCLSAGGCGDNPNSEDDQFKCRAALMYRLWLEGIRHGRDGRFHVGGAGLEIITLSSWSSLLESAAKVKGRREYLLQTGSAEATLQKENQGCSSIRMNQQDCLTQPLLVSGSL